MSLITATKTERDYILMCKDHFKLVNKNIATTDAAMNTIVANLKTKKIAVDADNKLLTANMMTILKSTWP